MNRTQTISWRPPAPPRSARPPSAARGAARCPKRRLQSSPATQPPLPPPSGRPYNPVVTLNGWTLPWRMRDGWKEFHLVAEPVVREIAPGMTANLWGYNGQSPGPTIEAVEGDRVRIFVTNQPARAHDDPLARHAACPTGMDGVGGLTQPQIPVGKTYVYEFVLAEVRHVHVPPARRRDGADGDGHDGLSRRAPAESAPHARRSRLRASCINAYDIDPGSCTPQVNTMLDFNLWTWNSRVFPGIDPLVCAPATACASASAT